MATGGTAAARATATARRAAHRAFGLLPPRVRRAVVGVVTPSFTVGALAVVHDGPRILFVTQAHRSGFALPGGLLGRREAARAALLRELREEIGWTDPTGVAPSPDTAHIDPLRRRVDLVWLLPRPAGSVTVQHGPDVLEHRWCTADDPGLTPQTREILAGVADRLPG
ncbi:NUDIX hydrolase [Nakamurella endophytica]|uniref:Nudix hydrolase domain-containing protein n=1 Tax=Nakamurella endophytica TaxID=1748367 RepID=A0A917SN60_9ACTN|nr:NUDIX hydrolase [Nakamurella endophytica]GGL88012.1 hypothetical protein GCM10011594_04560 [Nakamurella endophytica]